MIPLAQQRRELQQQPSGDNSNTAKTTVEYKYVFSFYEEATEVQVQDEKDTTTILTANMVSAISDGVEIAFFNAFETDPQLMQFQKSYNLKMIGVDVTEEEDSTPTDSNNDIDILLCPTDSSSSSCSNVLIRIAVEFTHSPNLDYGDLQLVLYNNNNQNNNIVSSYVTPSITDKISTLPNSNDLGGQNIQQITYVGPIPMVGSSYSMILRGVPQNVLMSSKQIQYFETTTRNYLQNYMSNNNMDAADNNDYSFSVLKVNVENQSPVQCERCLLRNRRRLNNEGSLTITGTIVGIQQQPLYYLDLVNQLNDGVSSAFVNELRNAFNATNQPQYLNEMKLGGSGGSPPTGDDINDEQDDEYLFFSGLSQLDLTDLEIYYLPGSNGDNIAGTIIDRSPPESVAPTTSPTLLPTTPAAKDDLGNQEAGDSLSSSRTPTYIGIGVGVVLVVVAALVVIYCRCYRKTRQRSNDDDRRRSSRDNPTKGHQQQQSGRDNSPEPTVVEPLSPPLPEKAKVKKVSSPPPSPSKPPPPPPQQQQLLHNNLVNAANDDGDKKINQPDDLDDRGDGAEAHPPTCSLDNEKKKKKKKQKAKVKKIPSPPPSPSKPLPPPPPQQLLDNNPVNVANDDDDDDDKESIPTDDRGDSAEAHPPTSSPDNEKKKKKKQQQQPDHSFDDHSLSKSLDDNVGLDKPCHPAPMMEPSPSPIPSTPHEQQHQSPGPTTDAEPALGGRDEPSGAAADATAVLSPATIRKWSLRPLRLYSDAPQLPTKPHSSPVPLDASAKPTPELPQHESGMPQKLLNPAPLTVAANPSPETTDYTQPKPLDEPPLSPGPSSVPSDKPQHQKASPKKKARAGKIETTRHGHRHGQTSNQVTEDKGVDAIGRCEEARLAAEEYLDDEIATFEADIDVNTNAEDSSASSYGY